MKYYRVPKELDQRSVYSAVQLQYVTTLTANELFTLRELEQMGMAWLAKKLEAVEVSRKKIYWFFGARFATEGAGKEATA